MNQISSVWMLHCTHNECKMRVAFVELNSKKRCDLLRVLKDNWLAVGRVAGGKVGGLIWDSSDSLIGCLVKSRAFTWSFRTDRSFIFENSTRMVQFGVNIVLLRFCNEKGWPSMGNWWSCRWTLHCVQLAFASSEFQAAIDNDFCHRIDKISALECMWVRQAQCTARRISSRLKFDLWKRKISF